MADYVKPFNATDPDASFVNGNPSAGVEGSIPDALMWEVWQRELKNLIAQSGQTPSNEDLTQVYKAVKALISSSTPTASLLHYGVDSGTANHIVLTTVTPAVATIVDGMIFEIVPAATNTGASDLKIGSIAARSIVKQNGGTPKAGDIAAGQPSFVIALGTTFYLLGKVDSDVLPYTPAGQAFAETFTGANAVANFAGGATSSYSGPFTTVSSVTITGASYVDIAGTCGFRALSATGTDCRARIRTTIQGQPAVIPISYQGCRPYSSTQIPVAAYLPLKGLDRTKSILIELIVDRTENDAQCVVQDPRLFVRHDGNP